VQGRGTGAPKQSNTLILAGSMLHVEVTCTAYAYRMVDNMYVGSAQPAAAAAAVCTVPARLW
jgi:hypothetical protein